MWKKWKVWVFVVVLLLSACSSNDKSESKMATDQEYAGSSSNAKMDKATAEDKSESDSANHGDQKQQIKNQRKVIYNADMQISVDKLENTMESVRNMVEDKNGYIVESNTSAGERGYESGTMVVRVPMDGFRAFLGEVRKLSKGTPHENIRGEDVTEEYVDLSSRLKAKQQVRDRLESFMKDAQRTEDLLKISADLASVQEEIEQIEGRLNFLKNQSDYSTVTIQFEVKNLQAEKLQTEQLNTWAKTKMLFMETVNFLVSAVSFVVVALFGLAPLWLILIAILYWVWLRSKKGQKKKPESPTTLD
ncbi:hypothetical protein AWM68_03595 [Fictibacillus phosphorivorans]|uniref:DUF4349 domain-containing protein n=1 Tax=Fictibacillus phosphorivorans TaxID=1221500 RepID=A0A163SLJ9_9BACL|nr:DUF4349 domain-containing protein [Fictibacillus phosphorivorans]KZE69362.1 hypothetical protein AWM68_03595 [Fictibacillus phosphorivorans]